MLAGAGTRGGIHSGRAGCLYEIVHSGAVGAQRGVSTSQQWQCDVHVRASLVDGMRLGRRRWFVRVRKGS